MNPYEVLEIPQGSSPEEIKAAYHRMAKQWHPDRFTGESKVEAEHKFRMLAEAFSMLRDAVRKEPSGVPAEPVAPPPPPPQQIQLDTSGEDRQGMPKTADDWFNEAKGAHDGRAHGRALALVTYALRMEPERGEFHALHARILDATGGDNRAKVKALETAIRLNPKDIDSLILLAKTFQNLGMQARATRLWEVVHNLAPNHPIFNQPSKGSAKGGPMGKEQIQGLGEQFTALVAETKIKLGKIFKRG